MMIPKPTRFTKIVRKMMSSGRVTMVVILTARPHLLLAHNSPVHQVTEFSQMRREWIVQSLAVLEPRQDNVGRYRRAAEDLLAEGVGDGVHHRSITSADRRLADAACADRCFGIR